LFINKVFPTKEEMKWGKARYVFVPKIPHEGKLS